MLGEAAPHGDWSSMQIPGTNGFCMHIAGLVGLMEVENAEEWAQVLDDVHMTLREVLQVVKSEYVPMHI